MAQEPQRGAALLELVAVMDRLRSPGGCPWDAEQTHESLVTYLLEETYETLEAIETGSLEHLREELGDLLLQVVFHARIGEEHERAPWSIDDVAAGVVAKLVRRHPHVFAPSEGDPGDAEGVQASWDELKTAEKSRTSSQDGVPLGLPALSLAASLVGRATRAGVDVEDADALDADALDADALGERLLALAAAGARSGIDPEAALRAACRRYTAAVRQVEAGRSAGPVEGIKG